MIDTSSAEKFYNSYHQYFIDNINISKTAEKNYKYVFYCFQNDETYCIEGSSMEEIYYKILFKIDYNCCDDIYCYEYPLNILKDPINLLKTHYFDTDNYIFKEVKFLQSDLDKEVIDKSIKVKINKKSEEEFYESYKKYYLRKVKFNISPIKYQYIVICKDLSDIFFVEGYSMEELYYIIFFKIDKQCWENIYDAEYEINELKKPLQLFKKHYLDSNDFIFEPIKFI